jgi:hypothetical protein
LGVGIDNERFEFQDSKASGQIHRGGSFSNPTFLVRNGNNFSHGVYDQNLKINIKQFQVHFL